MTDVHWIKITTSMFDDEKIRVIEAMPEADSILICWIKLLCLAGKVNANGFIFLAEQIPYTEETLANVFNRPLNTVKMAMEFFRRVGMVEFDVAGFLFLPNWEKHQNIIGLEEIRQQNRLRQQKRREQLVLSRDCHVTSQRNHATEVEVEVDKDLKDSKQGETTSPEVRPSSPKKESKPKVETPLAVKIYHRATNLFPAKLWWKILDEAIGDNPDALLLWSRVVTGWLGMGWSPKSVKLMLENFKRRQIPGEKDREWIPADIEPAPVDITEEQAEANRKRLAGMIAGITARMTV